MLSASLERYLKCWEKTCPTVLCWFQILYSSHTQHILMKKIGAHIFRGSFVSQMCLHLVKINKKTFESEPSFSSEQQNDFLQHYLIKMFKKCLGCRFIQGLGDYLINQFFQSIYY